MSLKMEYHSKKLALNLEGHLNWNLTQIGMSLKMGCHSELNVTQNGVSLNFECQSNWRPIDWKGCLTLRPQIAHQIC